MPAFEVPVPVGSTLFTIVDDDDEEYSIVIGTDTFTRTGKDGAEIICPIFHGDEFAGEVLEGFWKKAWNVNIGAPNQPFTAILDGSGTLEIMGEAAVAGVLGSAWLNGHLPIPLLGDLEVEVSMSVPVDDTGAVANRDINYDFYFRGDKKAVDAPSGDADFIRMRITVDEVGLILTLSKEVGTANTLLDSGHDYTMDGTTGTGDLEAIVLRFVFHNGVVGATAPENVRHMHVYMKQSDTIANAEAATENQLDDSPYDIDDLLFNVAYPAFMIFTQNAVIYDTGDEAKAGRITVDYPDFNVKYDVPDANIALGEVELYDGDPDGTGVRVYDEDHVFANDPYLQNGLIRLHLEEGDVYGIDIYGYISGAWNMPQDRTSIQLLTSATLTRYPWLLSIVSLSSEEVILSVRLFNNATQTPDFYTDNLITLRRGSYSLEVNPQAAHPEQNVKTTWTDVSVMRFGFIGDCLVGEADLTIDARNTTMTDNFMVGFDDDGDPLLIVWSTNLIPDIDSQWFRAADGAGFLFTGYKNADIEAWKMWYSIVPYALVANLFAEAEDETLVGGSTVVADGGASGGQSVLMNANAERVDFDIIAGTEIPEGRYMAMWRAYDLNQVLNDTGRWVYNNTDGEYRNEEGEIVIETMTAAYLHYCCVFDVTAADVTGTDTISLRFYKRTAGANSVWLDYILIVPIGDGESFPQDIAHAALREGTIVRRVLER